MSHDDCSIKEGKLALPYQYFAGEVGSRFLIALRDERKILAVRCEACAVTYLPPRKTCDRCFADLTKSWREVGPEGTLTSHTVVRASGKHAPLPTPYVLGLIRLDGTDHAIAHLVAGVDPEAVEPGCRLRPVYSDTPTNTILDITHFEPIA